MKALTFDSKKIVLVGTIVLGLSACKAEQSAQVESSQPKRETQSGNYTPTTFQGGEGGEGGNIGGDNGGPGSDGGNHNDFVTDHFAQNQFTEEYDFLWVVDNSGSMSNIRTFLSQNLTNFVSILESRRSLDWQMAVTNTDNVDTNGNLISSSTGVRVVNREMANVASVWASIISRIVGTAHSGWEQGLESGRSAIERFATEFSRPQVPLVLTYISDEQDYSCGSNCHNFSGVAESYTDVVYHPTSRYTDHLNTYKNSNGAEVVVYPIIHLSPLSGSGACDDYGTMGSRYRDVQTAVGTGQSMSLCPNDLAASINQVAQLTANRGVCFTLTHTVATIRDMVVLVDGTSVPSSSTDGYQYENNGICFSGTFIPGNGSIIDVTYRASN